MSVLVSVHAGTLVTVTATFKDESGTPTDPDTITLTYAQGASGFTPTTWTYGGTGSITRSGTGVYVADLDTTGLPGTWVGYWAGTGDCQATQPFSFNVTALPL